MHTHRDTHTYMHGQLDGVRSSAARHDGHHGFAQLAPVGAERMRCCGVGDLLRERGPADRICTVQDAHLRCPQSQHAGVERVARLVHKQ